MSKKKKRRVANDAFSNSAARLGIGTTDLTEATNYSMMRLLTQEQNTLTALYRDNWIVQNVCQIVPQDICRKWFEVVTAEFDTDVINNIMRKTLMRSKIQEGLEWGRLYGGAAALILIKGHDDLSIPLDLKTILPGSFQGLYILDRWNGVFPEVGLVTNPSDPEFGLPNYYTAKTENSTVRVHHSRLLRFEGRKLPYLEKIQNLYWGESEIEAIYNEIVARDNTAANITALTFKANVEYREVESLDLLLGTGNDQMKTAFWQTLQAQAALRSSQGVQLVNKGDQVHNETYTFAGLADIYDRKMMDVAGASRIPVTKLFGRSAAGMNATGENDMRNYYDYLDGERETQLRPPIEKLLPVLCMSAWGTVPKDVKIEFPPMETPDETKRAEAGAKKAEIVISAYQTNLIDKSTALKELRDIDGIFDKLTDEQTDVGEGVYFQDDQRMNDPFLRE